MVFIYALKCEELVLYVGQTINLKKRENIHRRKKGNTCNSKNIPEDSDWRMEVLEECKNNIAYEREGYYYELLKPLYNACVPNRNHSESNKNWYENNKEYKKEYNKNNRERRNELQRIYYEERKRKIKSIWLKE